MGVERFDRADRTGPARRRAARRGDLRSFEPDRRASARARGARPVAQHAHRLSRPDGRHVPRVGRAVAPVDAGPRCGASMQRLTCRAAVSEAARETAEANWTAHGDYVMLWNGIEIDRFANATPGAVERSRGVVPRPPRAAQGTRGAARRVARARPRRGAVGRGHRTADRRAAQARDPDVEWLGSISDGRTRAAHARRHGLLRAVARRRVVRRRAARGDGGGDADRRVRHHGVQNVARADREALLVPPGDAGALRAGLRRLLDDADLRERWSRAVGPEPPSSRWRASPSATSSCTNRDRVRAVDRESTRASNGCARRAVAAQSRATRSHPIARRVRRARGRVGVAPGGDATHGDRRDRGARRRDAAVRRRATSRSTRRTGATWRSVAARDLRRRSDRRHPARGGRTRVVLRVDRGRAAARATRRSATCRSASCTRSRPATASWPTRWRRTRRARRRPPIPSRPSANTDLGALFWTAGLRGRPMHADGDRARGADRRLVDARRLLRPRFGDVQHDADRHRAARRVRRHRPSRRRRRSRRSKPRFRAVGEGALCTNFPYDVAAAGLIVAEAGGVVTRADGGSLAGHPAVGSGDGYGLAVLAAAPKPCTRCCFRSSTGAWHASALAGSRGMSPV